MTAFTQDILKPFYLQSRPFTCFCLCGAAPRNTLSQPLRFRNKNMIKRVNVAAG